MTQTKIDILAFGAHPDDVELSAAGTLLKEAAKGKKIGVIDLTQGELGTRGSAELRMKEANASASILGLSCRENLKMKDGFFQNDEAHIRDIVRMIRKYRPEIVLANAPSDRHPDHGRAAKLVADACFYSGLMKIETEEEGKSQEAWRPKALYHYIQDYYQKPDFVLDVSDYVEQKMQAIKAFGSQFYDPDSKEPDSPIAVKNFFDFIEGRMINMGRYILADYGEGFLKSRPLGVESLTHLL
ncbi:MAG: bacillithiol biosynthesis deacetylase BshB1 [Flavobacteriales bacterium]|nr:bacillithiol biosynthesis deacetylase BshB1 [Flavobacteriales bacterium]|tara:strand:- start:471 stop:1196 length:726 start_codon:yes stop_codon:yes gene_type:complete